jgi:hypothetical protein
MRLLRVSKVHRLLHGIRAGSFDNDGYFLLVVEHVFSQIKMPHVRGVLKCPTLLRDPCLVHFISHSISSSLEASFESE